MDFKQKKEEIEKLLNSVQLDAANICIDAYEQIAPKDMELVNYKAIYFFYLGEVECAFKLLKNAVVQYPMNEEINYNLAYAYEQKNDLLNAFKYYNRAYLLYSANGKEKVGQEIGVQDKIDNIQKIILEDFEKGIIDSEELKKLKDGMDTYFGLIIKYFREDVPCIGSRVWFLENECRYIAFQRAVFQQFIPESIRSLYHVKGELLVADEAVKRCISSEGNEYLLPIAIDEIGTLIDIKEGNRNYRIQPKQTKQFGYYKVQAGATVTTSKAAIFSEPIRIGHSPSRKKLVLNIFVDGLSENVLKENMAEIMPYTFNYFKDGAICTNAHSAAEWTYPSLTSLISGLNIVNHMLYHNQLDGALRDDVKTLAEYFKEAGYYTAKIDGDWRSVPYYGHTRGIDRYIYQNSGIGMKEENMIGEVIDHLEAFKDVDQYLWFCIDDLHNIADGISSPISVQNKMELYEHEDDEIGSTSVKQNYSDKKISRYKKGIKHIDSLLNLLYHYIQDNYSEDDVVVSLFADHGQGYLVPNGGHFISENRTNTAFMFKGGVKIGEIDELISGCDYKAIMCKLAGIELVDEFTDGKLPKAFGGSKKREWVLSESLHPEDPYRATYYTSDKIFYFENGEKTQNDGRFAIKDAKISVEDYEGNEVDDIDFANKYYDILMEHVAPLIIY